jgi:hypothetical protein
MARSSISLIEMEEYLRIIFLSISERDAILDDDASDEMDHEVAA